MSRGLECEQGGPEVPMRAAPEATSPFHHRQGERWPVTHILPFVEDFKLDSFALNHSPEAPVVPINI